MHIHILGIAGTFMGSLALIAKQLGHKVSGMDAGIYPPMSTQLDTHQIDYVQNYDPANLPKADLFLIGNALSRGNPCVEVILTRQYRYLSGAQWLSEAVLRDKWVLAVSGTHGKTTTASMLAWILECAGLNPSFLIGGVPQNFTESSRLTSSDYFVIEADEYDTAFFDKRSKFLHYHPKTLVINNLEFDHADIFDSLKDIQKQFHHLLRLVPQAGIVIYPEHQPNIEQVITQGIWSEQLKVQLPHLTTTADGTEFAIDGHLLKWHLLGTHNMANALSAVRASEHINIPVQQAIQALTHFRGVKRRLELLYQSPKISVYDDFAHHPSAIQTTLSGLRAKVGDAPIIAILELRSNTMKNGVHQQTLVDALSEADTVLLLKPHDIEWDIDSLFHYNLFATHKSILLFESVDALVQRLAEIQHGHFLVMSNGSFGGIQHKIIAQLPSV